jgi:hypothetical protein
MTSHYDDILNELRQKGERLVNQYIVELYNILRDEEKMPPCLRKMHFFMRGEIL